MEPTPDEIAALHSYRRETAVALDILRDARHAATHDRPAIADELIERAMDYITKARDVHTEIIHSYL
jgi:cellobiose-specific phosphotransferase system component IIA